MTTDDRGAGSSGSASLPRPQRAQRDGAPVTVTVLGPGLEIDGVLLDWLDIDTVVEGDHRVALHLANGTVTTLSMLGATHDRFLTELRAERRRARYAALTIATGEPTASYLSRAADGPVDVHLFPKVLVAEPRSGSPVAVPLSLVSSVDRSGYTITVTAAGLDPLVVTALGAKSDEFVMRLAQARRDLLIATAAAYAQFDAALEGLSAPDGCAVDAAGAGTYWSALLDRAEGGSRANEVRLLAELAGERLRIGIYTEGGTSTLPFVLAPIGEFVVVEATDGDDRATFVFRTADVARLNAVLLLTSFRREALFLTDDRLGRWAVAVRTWAAVREARAALVARVIHDEQWETKVRAALGR